MHKIGIQLYAENVVGWLMLSSWFMTVTCKPTLAKGIGLSVLRITPWVLISNYQKCVPWKLHLNQMPFEPKWLCRTAPCFHADSCAQTHPQQHFLSICALHIGNSAYYGSHMHTNKRMIYYVNLLWLLSIWCLVSFRYHLCLHKIGIILFSKNQFYYIHPSTFFSKFEKISFLRVLYETRLLNVKFRNYWENFTVCANIGICETDFVRRFSFQNEV